MKEKIACRKYVVIAALEAKEVGLKEVIRPCHLQQQRFEVNNKSMKPIVTFV